MNINKWWTVGGRHTRARIVKRLRTKFQNVCLNECVVQDCIGSNCGEWCVVVFFLLKIENTNCLLWMWSSSKLIKDKINSRSIYSILFILFTACYHWDSSRIYIFLPWFIVQGARLPWPALLRLFWKRLEFDLIAICCRQLAFTFQLSWNLFRVKSKCSSQGNALSTLRPHRVRVRTVYT